MKYKNKVFRYSRNIRILWSTPTNSRNRKNAPVSMWYKKTNFLDSTANQKVTNHRHMRGLYVICRATHEFAQASTGQKWQIHIFDNPEHLMTNPCQFLHKTKNHTFVNNSSGTKNALFLKIWYTLWKTPLCPQYRQFSESPENLQGSRIVGNKLVRCFQNSNILSHFSSNWSMSLKTTPFLSHHQFCNFFPKLA